MGRIRKVHELIRTGIGAIGVPGGDYQVWLIFHNINDNDRRAEFKMSPGDARALARDLDRWASRAESLAVEFENGIYTPCTITEVEL